MTGKIVVFSTCGSQDEAERVAQALLHKRVAACVNIVPRVRSLYWWQGKIELAAEFLLIIKSSQDLFPELRTTLQALHSYEVAECIALPILDGSPAYLQWIDNELDHSHPRPPL